VEGGTALLKNWHYFHRCRHRLPRAPGHDDCIESRRYNRYDDDVIVIPWLYYYSHTRRAAAIRAQ